jgi:hypothetical protein
MASGTSLMHDLTSREAGSIFFIMVQRLGKTLLRHMIGLNGEARCSTAT